MYSTSFLIGMQAIQQRNANSLDVNLSSRESGGEYT